MQVPAPQPDGESVNLLLGRELLPAAELAWPPTRNNFVTRLGQ
jgi:hypothetical protein